MSKITVDIVTPKGIHYSGQIIGMTAPGLDGRFQILYNHAGLLAALAPGEIELIHSSGSQSVRIGGGLLEVIKNQVNVMVESVEEAGDAE